MTYAQVQADLNEVAAALQDPDYIAFLTQGFDAFIPADKISRFLTTKEKQDRLPAPAKLQKMAEDERKAKLQREQEEHQRILELCKIPSSRQATEFFRANLDHPFFARWKKAYAKVVKPEHVVYVEAVVKDRPDPQTRPFWFDDDPPEIKRNYPKQRKTRSTFRVNQRKVYDFVRQNPQAHDAEIAGATGISPASITRCLRALENEGFIKKMTIRRWGVCRPDGERQWVNERTICFLNPLPDTL